MSNECPSNSNAWMYGGRRWLTSTWPYQIAGQLPRQEEYNLKSQLLRAAASVALNIAEGSTGQSDAEQARFLGMALRSLVETVACQELIRSRAYLTDPTLLDQAYRHADQLAAQIQAFRRKLSPYNAQVREEPLDSYDID